jgi:hypothetical protein
MPEREHPNVTFAKSLEALADSVEIEMKPKMGEVELRLLQREEHDAWRQLCFELKSRGVVTELDLESPVGRSDTPGQRLLDSIRAWSALQARLMGSKR